MDEALLSIRPAGHRQLVKSSLLLNIMVCLDQIVHAYWFQHYPATGMQNGDETAGVI